MRGDDEVSTASARVAFLNDEPVGPAVRQPILASWARSREHHVAPDRIELGDEADGYRSTPLRELVTPVVDDAVDLLSGEPVSLILCDEQGVVLERRTGDGRLSRHLDRVWLAPGFSYAERRVGTNGIGTALESRGPAHVFGPEHWAEGLEDLACAAAPVRHPVSRRIVGVVNLTCWRRDAGPLLVATTALLARQVEDRLREQAGRRESAVLDDFLAVSRRSRHAVVAVTGDVVMLDETARENLDGGDQTRLVAATAEVMASGRPAQVLVDLPSGRTVRVACRPTWWDGATGGGVLVVRPLAPPALPSLPSAAPAPRAPDGRHPVAVGSGTLWTMCRRTVERHRAAGEWLVLRGEPGSGRRTLARAAVGPGPGAVRVLEPATHGGTWAAEVTAALTRRHGTLVLADVDRLPPADVRRLTDLLEPHRWSSVPDRPWVVVTVGPDRPDGTLRRLVERFPATVDVPPLRHRGEDVADLTRHVLDRLGHPRLVVGAAAAHALARCRWPGNVTQLVDVLTRVVARRRSGTLEPDDLPAEVFLGGRRVLTPVEALECDAIVRALRASGGSKTRAAAMLGMSRATVYRKVRGYGISL